MRRGARVVLAVAISAAGAAPGAARAQTMLDQEERLIDIHSLLLDLPPLQAPGALERRQVDAALELVSIPEIDGATGSNEQITASDRTRLFPRPRVALGLPAPRGFRAFVGISYVPPVPIRDVATNAAAVEAGIALVRGAFRAGVRGHAVYARSTAPVTDPDSRDVLETRIVGGALSAGGRIAASSRLALEPYAGVGVTALRGRFRVTSDGNVLTSDWTGPALHAGVRALLRDRWELVAEVIDYPDRLFHTNVRLGYLFGI
ncbi:MAG TPA: hypothetical protein VFL83_07095 [Anaeromyxobacter sp.]|nr:hypothetical protein [Anaeromyxobacter sp.]